MPNPTDVMTLQAVSLKTAMSRLWSDHVVWTRDYIVAALAGAADAEAAANRLLKNQEDIGNAVVPIYGDEAGKALTDLLKQHILIAVELVDAAKSGDNEKFQENDRKWTDNAEEIATLLSGANPENWPKADVVDLLRQHLELTKGEVVARLEQNWEKDIEAFDQIFTEILTVADVLTSGIINQFPEKFGRASTENSSTGDAGLRTAPADQDAGSSSAAPTNPEKEKGITFGGNQAGFDIGGMRGTGD
jgi:hypothetical protein